MELDVNRIDLWFRRTLLASAALLVSLQMIFGDENPWLRGALILCMAGVVGYFTNFLALKMLFQPKQGSVLGWSGLVPRNKELIARRLGESVQTQLLSPDIIMQYITERNLVEQGTRQVEEWIDDALQDPEVRQRLNARIVTVLQERGPDALMWAFDFSEEQLKDLVRRPEVIAEAWHPLRQRLQRTLEKEDNRRQAAEYMRHALLEELPRLAEALDRAIDTYLERRRAMGRVGKQIRTMASFDVKAIQDMLERFVNDPATREQFIGVVDILIEQFQDRLDAPETRALIEQRIEGWVDQAGGYARDELLPKAIEALQRWLADEKNWDQIDDYISRIMHQSKRWLSDWVNSPEGQALIRQNIERLVQRVNVTALVEEQVMRLDTDELEQMILDNTGGNLVVIQVLGGVLGLVVGTIQVNVMAAFPVFGLVLLVWILAWFNRRGFAT